MRKREEHREKIKTQIHSHFSIHRPILGRLVKNRSFFRFYLLFEPMIVALLPRPALDLTTGFSKKDARYLKIESNFKSFNFTPISLEAQDYFQFRKTGVFLDIL